jgi:hypothetical protein
MMRRLVRQIRDLAGMIDQDAVNLVGDAALRDGYSWGRRLSQH